MGQVYNIPSAYGFADALARTLLQTGDPLDLAQTQIYLPTRRAVRALQAAFADQARGCPRILPRLFALGDLEEEGLALTASEELGLDALELPPAMGSAQRIFLLTRLIDQAWPRLMGPDQPKSQTQVLGCARALMTLLDTLETEGLSLSVLDQLAPEDPELAEFWEHTAHFIALVQEAWPGLEAAVGRISPATRRRRLIELQAATWQEAPPEHPIILAGTTATIPAVAMLAKTILGLPKGQLVLPGLDGRLECATWELVGASPSHPQFGLYALLSSLGLSPQAIPLWPGCQEPSDLDRHWAVSAAQRPVGAVALAPPEALDLEGLKLAEAVSPEQEARAIALFLREAIEAPRAKAALVTPDRDLAGRVAVELQRWGLGIDDSAGRPLLASPAGRLLQQSAACLGPDLPTLGLTTLLLSSLVTFGDAPSKARAFARGVDLNLRGQGERLSPDQIAWPSSPFATALTAFFAGVADDAARYKPLDAWVDRHLKLVDILSPEAEALWTGPAGEELAHLLEELRAQADILPPLSLAAYEDLLALFLREGRYRPTYGSHPRLSILGTLEARLLKVDAVALGGLNEGTWPKETDLGPWMNRPMRAKVGLPSPERKIGLAAHDLAQAMSANRVLLTRAKCVDGTPTLPSRWVERLKALTSLTGQEEVLQAQPYLDWAQTLDAAPARDQGVQLACPPVSARPKLLRATDIGPLVTNPYAVYAHRILRLRALDPRGVPPKSLLWGNLVHEVLRIAVRDRLTRPEALCELADSLIARLPLDVGERSLWQTHFRHCLAEFLRLNAPYDGLPTFVEVTGSLAVDEVEIEGRADRLVQTPKELYVLDYKTGTPPSLSKQRDGQDPQLPILGLIAETGGFEGLRPPVVTQAFFGLPRRIQDQGVETKSDKKIREQVTEGLKTLLRAYADPKQPYLSAPYGDEFVPYDDYAHLARRN